MSVFTVEAAAAKPCPAVVAENASTVKDIVSVPLVNAIKLAGGAAIVGAEVPLVHLYDTDNGAVWSTIALGSIATKLMVCACVVNLHTEVILAFTVTAWVSAA